MNPYDSPKYELPDELYGAALWLIEYAISDLDFGLQPPFECEPNEEVLIRLSNWAKANHE
jgi:hypothetical protein